MISFVRLFSLRPIALGLLLGLVAAAPASALRQGDRLQLGTAATADAALKPVSVPWQQADAGAIAVADTAAWQWLGLELLATTDNARVQPVRWFGEIVPLPVTHTGPYRYLDLAPLLARSTGQVVVNDDRTAQIQAPNPEAIATIRDLRFNRQAWGWRVVLELDRPTLWQQRFTRKQAAIALPAVLAPQANAAVAALTSAPEATEDGDRPALSVTTESTHTQLQLEIPTGLGLRATTLANPPRLVLDLRADALSDRAIQWRPGLRWQQRYLELEGDRFAITWLEIDAAEASRLRPFWAGEISGEAPEIPGLLPLRQMARPRRLAVAINGGFFNRNNKFPLGALRQNDRWLSSPILNRGIVAWGDRDGFWFGRGRFFEVFQTAAQRWPGIFLNSGYVQPGLARYTPAWGPTYTPASDGETIVTVGGNRILQRVAAGSSAIAIPRDGYAIAIRDAPQLATAFVPGTPIAIEQGTVPPELQQFPQALGAGPLLLQDGRLVLDAAAESFSTAFARQAAPRSAIARDRRGNLLLVAFGDRVGGKGPTLTETARLLQLLGATDALNLDGGSSASLYLGGELINRPPATGARVHNGLGF